ncbi:MAG: RlmE family RNA methyltransferase [Hyphomicrobiaceae bacterium]|nr:RlmE family RNA methyltransferase [Hyphomicrobiaceae bacterium]
MSRSQKRRSGGAKAGSGARSLGVRVKTAKGRKVSSTRWLERQLNDPYVQAAKRDGFRSRAAYKLTEIDEKYGLLKPGDVVVDLGAAPGGWSQVAAQKVGSADGNGMVVALDLQEIDPIAGVTALQADFMEDEGLERLRHEFGDRKTDVVLSDMAAAATGHKQTDHLRIVALCEAALEFAEEVLAPEGRFLAKVLQGGTERDLLDRLKRSFKSVRHVKPEASRADSAELYVLATGYRGTD